MSCPLFFFVADRPCCLMYNSATLRIRVGPLIWGRCPTYIPMLWLMLLVQVYTERVYDWVHVEREHGILYNSTSFVVPIPLLPVDQHNIGTVLVPLPPTFPRFSLQTGCMLPRFVITLERPLLIFSSFVTQTGLCSTHLCSFAHQTRIHVAEYLHKLWIFVTW